MKDSIEKIALIGILLFFCTSAVILAVASYHPQKSGINWQFRPDPNMPVHDCFIVSTSPFDGQEISGTVPISIKYTGASGICKWNFDGSSEWFTMLYYGKGRDGLQEAQGLFDTTPFPGEHIITFRVWLLNGSRMERSVDVVIQN